MGAHAAFGQFGNGEFGRWQYRHRILAPLDAIDDERGLLPRHRRPTLRHGGRWQRAEDP